MTTLLVGFDAAWTRTNSGAIVGVIRHDDGAFQHLGPPKVTDYAEASAVILKWQTEMRPNSVARTKR
jgi:predicted RNase H-like nuclease